MGRTGSSSKRKSSKKKISKISSEARQKRRSRKIKSKKLRCHDDSVSSYSDDESSSSLSVSSSSSEDDYRSRKSRSRTQGDVKGSRKRVGRSSSSRGCSIDSPHVKKKKRNADSKSRKKRSKKKKKKYRRDASISSASSDTRSCSPCQGGSDSGSEERESERLRGRSRERKKDKRNSGKGRSVARKSRDRSRSCSSCSKLSDSVGNNTIELFAVESNSRRLRSVITVVTRAEEREGNEENNDEFKEEIVYDHDDYPSCRSNDSNDGANKRESAQRTVENVIGEEPSISNLITLKPTLASKNGGDKYDALDRSFDGAGSVSPNEKEGDVKDLELILRQRALENLKRFRGGRQINELVSVDEKNKSNSEMKPLSTAETEFVQKKRAVENLKIFRGGRQANEVIPLDEKYESNYEMKPLSTGEAEFVQNNQLKQEDPGITGVSQSAVRRSRFTWRRDSSLPTGTDEKIPPEKHGGTGPATAKHTVASLPPLGFSGGSEEKDRNIRLLASRLQTLPSANFSLTDCANKSADETSLTLAESSSNTRDIGNSDARGPTVLEAPSSLLAEEGSSRKQQTEAKDGSQFEQKTMSVMRGGEMVQVSYKVYIPKKAPALARRQLKR